MVPIIASRIRDCNPPYVMGIGGTWGSGKTSFLRKTWAVLGGNDSLYFPNKPNSIKPKTGEHIIWFNPWHHQFEASPAVALLHEIHKHLSMTDRAINEAKKLGTVTILTALNYLGDLGKMLGAEGIQGIKTDEIQKRGENWEAERFQTSLTSEKFRTVFEKTLAQIIGKNGRLYIFIDDLDRCERDIPFKLLEALKLYLSARNCVYILGLDRHHLERSIAKELTGSSDTGPQLAHAREYLGKMFQSYYLLPRPESMEGYISSVLNLAGDPGFNTLLVTRFGYKPNQENIAQTLDQNLPHNPRKIKAFVHSWQLYLQTLEKQVPANVPLDWKTTVVLHYLGQFEEPLLRRLEEFPGAFWTDIKSFADIGVSEDNRFDGLEISPELSLVSDSLTPPPLSRPAEQKALAAHQKRLFYIVPLVRTTTLDPTAIRRHLPRAG